MIHLDILLIFDQTAQKKEATSLKTDHKFPGFVGGLLLR